MPYIKESLFNTSLPTLTIEQRKKYKEYPQIGFGGEGSVHKYNGQIAFKTFDFFEEKELLPRKFAKIEELAKLQDESFAFPIGLVGYEDEKKEGYFNNLIVPLESYKDFDDLQYLYDLNKLKNYIIKASAAMQRIHKKGVILGDVRGDNIMIDENGNPIFVDTDNYAYGDYTFDLPDYRIKTIDKIYGQEFSGEDRDRFLFAMMALQFYLDGTVIRALASEVYFKKMIESLNVAPEIKDGLRLIFSDAHNKPYFGEVIENFPTEQEQIISRQKVYQLNRYYRR